MAAAVTPIFPDTPIAAKASITAAFTNRTTTGVGSLTLLHTAGADGTRLDRLAYKAEGTTAQAVLLLWLYSGSGDAKVWKEFTIDVTNVSGVTTKYFEFQFDFDRETLPAGWSLYVSQTAKAASNANVFLFGGDY